MRPEDEQAKGHSAPQLSELRQIEKLQRINEALVQRLERFQEQRGPGYALTRTAAVLEREVLARNRDLESALTSLATTNAELSTARAIADEANRAKSRFLRAASHDLLQPLSAAKLFLSHLSELVDQSDQRALVSHLTATIESAEELIRALSNIAKLDSQSFQMNPAPVALGRLFRRLVIDMQPLAFSRGIDLRFAASSVTVESDPIYLRQIAQNLIANALKYTTGRKVLVGVRHDGPRVWLEVLDQGPGIALRDQDRVFNEFERLSRSEQPGTGLGLSIVRRACQQLDHPLELHSVPGRGSRFRVRLPRSGSPTAPPPDRDAESTRDLPQNGPPRDGADGLRTGWPALAGLAGRRVLIVENDMAMRRALVLLLNGWGMEVQEAHSIDIARQHVANRPPDLVLTDYRLDSGETGIQAINVITSDLARQPPALIVTAETPAAIRAEAAGLQVEVLEKPVAEHELRRAMGRALKLSP